MSNPSFSLYGWNTPNGQKIVIALEEIGAQYEYHPVDIGRGEQHSTHFRSISPDGKIPALVTRSEPELCLFESGAILLYLADRYPQLHGKSDVEKAQVLSWTFWQVGQLGPMAGQFGRFNGADSYNPQAVKHFEQVVRRCLDVMEKRLNQSAYLAGDSLTIADIASLPWIASKQSYLQIYKFEWRSQYPALLRWAEALSKRSSVIKAFSTHTNTG